MVIRSAYVIQQSIPALTRKVGKSSKNLVEKDSNRDGTTDVVYRYKYKTFNEEGCPTKIEVYRIQDPSSGDEVGSLAGTYTISYGE